MGDEFIVALGGVSVLLICKIAAAGKVNLMIFPGLFGKLRGSADVAHRISTTPDGARVRLASMHNPSVMNAAVVGLQFAGDGAAVIPL